jgi:hypothetical protein
LKGEGEHKGNAVGECHGAGDFDEQAHAARGEDSEIEEEEADFCQGDAEDVDDFLDIEELNGQKRLVRHQSNIRRARRVRRGFE